MMVAVGPCDRPGCASGYMSMTMEEWEKHPDNPRLIIKVQPILPFYRVQFSMLKGEGREKWHAPVIKADGQGTVFIGLCRKHRAEVNFPQEDDG